MGRKIGIQIKKEGKRKGINLNKTKKMGVEKWKKYLIKRVQRGSFPT